MWYVYILLCEDKSLYTGISNNLRQRFIDHKKGKGGAYTRSHKPLKIVYSEKHSTKSEALKKEIRIKSLSRKKKIEVLRLTV
jgi:putative endonuclease